MFRTVLIANRGVVACRILRTLRGLGVRGAVVYDAADADSRHVAEADEAIFLGAGPARETYLDQAKIFAAARRAGAEAIHPGYGFLAEDAGFAAACAREGFVFVGPTPEQMRALGDKRAARERARALGLAVLPGGEALLDLAAARAEAGRLGWPVMLKRTDGGGGLGLRRCDDEAALAAAFAELGGGARGCFLEKLLPAARHLEVQLFGDGRGRVAVLGERDCSAQRRHQKVIEETPAPGLDAVARAELHAAARRLAESVGYRSAGTAEFLRDEADGRVYFLEFNPRLQVEHGVTEEAAGVDLVAWMLREAAGELDLAAPEHAAALRAGAEPARVAMQARVCAEDPGRGFEPSAGVLTAVEFPPAGLARVETWVERGAEVPPFHDPLLAKIIVSAPTRAEAARKLAAALAAARLDGVATNLEFLRHAITRPEFLAGGAPTAWLGSLAWRPRAVEVLDGGAQTTVQDHPGRVGYWAVGVPPSGPMDDLAHRAANLLAGNAPGAAALEITLAGPTLRFHADAWVALCGTEFAAELDGAPAPWGRAFAVRAGSVLRVGEVRGDGCRAALAVRGGFDTPDYLGSKSTFALGKFGGFAGRALRAGDRLPLGPAPAGEPAPRALPAAFDRLAATRREIAVLAGPHAAPDFFTEESFAEIFAAEYRVEHHCNRLGVRLAGPRPVFARADGGEAGLHPSNIHDTPYAVGMVNFTGDTPVILGRDGPSLGGFVSPITVIEADLWKVGQLRPGDAVRFRRVGHAEAAARRAAQEATLAGVGEPEAVAAAPRVEAVVEPAVLRALPARPGRPAVAYRAAGDRYLIVEYESGSPSLDLDLRFRVHALQRRLRSRAPRGLGELTPGVRSLQVAYAGGAGRLPSLVGQLAALEAELPPAETLALPSRVVRLPLAFDAASTRAAVERYRRTVRAEAPWLPDNIEFIRRINGLGSVEEVEHALYSARHLVLGLGDVYLGAPCAVALDPRHRLQTTKYNPARTWTAEGEVGVGGVFLCVYGTESPGGYQLVGRTVPMWNPHRVTHEFEAGRPWLLRSFDQIAFYPMPEAELEEFRREFLRGRASLDITETTFSVADYHAALVRDREEIAAFRERQARAFAAERERWSGGGGAACAESAARPCSVVRPPERGAVAVRAALAGGVWEVAVRPGESVEAGRRLATVEAMKMEAPVPAPASGVVATVEVEAGERVDAGRTLFTLGPRSLDLASLRAAYAAGDRPEDVVREVYARIAARGDDRVWITLRPEAEVVAEARALAARRAAGETLPLYGAPFAAKDNLDAAGLPTTAGCPEYAYRPEADAEVVRRLRAAGALLIGKTNMDQFATGLSGVRSPHGAPDCVFDKNYISGGSSSGSAVAVAAGLVSFALGSDTAGSGRVPAAFNNLVGWKPTRGLLSTRGLVPACRSLDCVSVLALTCEDAAAAGAAAAGYDEADPFSRLAPAGAAADAWPDGGAGRTFRFGVLRREDREFFGDAEAARLYAEAIERTRALGGEPVEIDYAPFRATAELLYAGPWLAERLAALSPFIDRHPGALHPVTAAILGEARQFSAVDAFRAHYRLAELRRAVAPTWAAAEALLLPTTPTIYRHAEVAAEPVALNSRLGIYTNFVNLLDLAAVAVPAGFRADGVPLGVTLMAPAFRDAALLALGARLHAALGGRLGATLAAHPAPAGPAAPARGVFSDTSSP